MHAVLYICVCTDCIDTSRANYVNVSILTVEKAHAGRHEVANGGPSFLPRRQQQSSGPTSIQRPPNYLQLTKAAASKRTSKYVYFNGLSG